MTGEEIRAAQRNAAGAAFQAYLDSLEEQGVHPSMGYPTHLSANKFLIDGNPFLIILEATTSLERIAEVEQMVADELSGPQKDPN